MNIFFLDRNPKLAAMYHNDKHVVKMVVETAQLLSTAHRVLDGEMYIDETSGRKIKRWRIHDYREDILYKATHINHPSASWVRESSSNYEYTYNLFCALCDEYTYRYGKIHESHKRLRNVLSTAPKNIQISEMTNPPQAMPDYCKDDDTVMAYRNYYRNEKFEMSIYTKRDIPKWML